MAAADACRLKIAFIGGGSSAHVLVAFAGSKHDVRLYTSRPQEWGEVKVSRETTDVDNNVAYVGRASLYSDDMSKVVEGADVVLFCSPVATYPTFLRKIAPFVKKEAFVGAIYLQGLHFSLAARSAGIPETCTLFGFYLYPFVSRVIKYGASAYYFSKRFTTVAVHGPRAEDAIPMIKRWLIEPRDVRPLPGNFTAGILNTANTSIHPARLHAVFRDWDMKSDFPRGSFPFLYADMDDYSSASIDRVGAEIQNVRAGLEQAIPGLDLKDGVVTYFRDFKTVYGNLVRDDSTLTSAFRTNQAFSSIPLPFDEVPGKPDRIAFPRSSRMLLDDVPFGLLPVKYIAELLNVDTPEIDSLILWSQKALGKQYMDEDTRRLSGADSRENPLHGHSIGEIVKGEVK